MANLFLASEILEMNIQEEHNGAAFYQQLAERSTLEQVRQAAAAIAQQERQHEALFSQMRQACEQPEPVETYPGEYDQYLQALLRNKMFADETDAQRKAAGWSDRQALEFALATEQATLNLLKELVKQIDSRELALVQMTVDEELNHVKTLHDLLSSLPA